VPLSSQSLRRAVHLSVSPSFRPSVRPSVLPSVGQLISHSASQPASQPGNQLVGTEVVSQGLPVCQSSFLRFLSFLLAVVFLRLFCDKQMTPFLFLVLSKFSEKFSLSRGWVYLLRLYILVLQGKREYLDKLHKYLEIHGTFFGLTVRSLDSSVHLRLKNK